MVHRSATRRFTLATAVAGLVGGTVAVSSPVRAAGPGPGSPSSIVIGVDHADPANQQPKRGRVFEYTDFFSRSATVHRGEVVNFRAAPHSFHIVGLAKSYDAALDAYPFVFNDRDDPNAPNGGPKIAFGSSNFPVTGGSTTHPATGVADFTKPFGPPNCGSGSQPHCTFTGGDDVEIAGPNPGTDQPADWRIAINAPAGTYHYFCAVHPNMTGTLHVVGDDDVVSTQSQIDAASDTQFTADRAAAVEAEQDANRVRHSDDAPGHRTYQVSVGVNAGGDHVAINEMLPNPQTVKGGMPALTRGDRVEYVWKDPHNVHSVFFPAQPPGFVNDVSPFGFDCNSGYQPATGPPSCNETAEPGPTSPPFNPPFEGILDPGNAPSGTVLTSPSQTVDSGVLVGKGYELRPSVQRWSVRTDHTTAGGSQPYLFHCTIHDFMVGGFTVTA